jgi:hypothetical protein
MTRTITLHLGALSWRARLIFAWSALRGRAVETQGVIPELDAFDARAERARANLPS